MITIIGANGSMGKRYQAILNYMGKNHRCFDREHSFDDILGSVADSTHAIIASPTASHVMFLRKVLPFKNCEVLCEKAITKNMDELTDITNEYYSASRKFTMMMQYKDLVTNYDTGKLSEYDYFRTGPDGLTWDCLQIIGLARGPVVINNNSPIWKCSINGQILSISDMDRAYVRFVGRWLHGEIDQSMDEIKYMHEKVHQFMGLQ